MSHSMILKDEPEGPNYLDRSSTCVRTI